MVVKVGFLLFCVLSISESSTNQEEKVDYEILSSSHSNITAPLSPDGSQVLTVLTEMKGSDTNGQTMSTQNTTYVVNQGDGNISTSYVVNHIGNTTTAYIVNNVGNTTVYPVTEKPQYFG